MVLDIITLVEASAGAVTALSGSYAAWRHVRYSIQGKKDRDRQEILNRANEELAKVEAKFEDKIRKIEIELQAQKLNVNRDLSHMKEIYNAEIKTLADKIDLLRSDLADQHSSMISLLTKLVGTR